MKKRLLPLAVLLCLTIALAAAPAMAADAPVEIHDVEGLMAIADDLEGNYILTSDITLTEAWTPITVLADPTGYPEFTGTLDGDGHVISGFFTDPEMDFASFIGDLGEGGLICRLGIITTGTGASSLYEASALVSYMNGGTLRNCFVSATVSSAEPECAAGGLVARMFDGTISGCYSLGTVNAEAAGGLVGAIEGGTIQDSFSQTEVVGWEVAGGLVGMTTVEADILIERCYASGAVSLTRQDPVNLGGFIGSMDYGTELNSCFFQLTGTDTPRGLGLGSAPVDSDELQGYSASQLTFGDLPAADWNNPLWHVEAGYYPRLYWPMPEDPSTQAPPSPIQDNSISVLAPAAPGEPPTARFSYSLTFAPASGALSYKIQFYDRETGEKLSVLSHYQPLHPWPGSEDANNIYVDLTSLLDAAARAMVAPPVEAAQARSVPTPLSLLKAKRSSFTPMPLASPPVTGPTIFNFDVTITPVGPLGREGDESAKAMLPVFYRLNSITQPEPIICEVGDSLTAPATVTYFYGDGQEAVGDVAWSSIFSDVIPSQADFRGRHVYSASVRLPSNILNPDDLVVEQEVKSYDTKQPPTGLAWDAENPGTATWVFPDGVARVADVQLLNASGQPIGEPVYALDDSYDFLSKIRAAGSGSYRCRVRCSTSGNEYYRASEWVELAETYTYIAPYIPPVGGVTPTPPPEDTRPAWNPFEDVQRGDWFYDSVQQVYEAGLMEGVSPTRFAPLWDTTRGMVVTILWRLAGSPQATAPASFSDLEPDGYYLDALAWAAEQDIARGYDDGRFGPGDLVTREQLAAMLWRYAGSPAVTDVTMDFTDAHLISGYAQTPMAWAVEQGLLTGRGNGQLAPAATATRGELAAVMARFSQ